MNNARLTPTWHELEAAYWAQGGKPKPPSTFTHENREWTRCARRFPSNSGKSAQWSADFSADDGSVVKDPHPPLLNRRNDAKRNWGLGRE